MPFFKIKKLTQDLLFECHYPDHKIGIPLISAENEPDCDSFLITNINEPINFEKNPNSLCYSSKFHQMEKIADSNEKLEFTDSSKRIYNFACGNSFEIKLNEEPEIQSYDCSLIELNRPMREKTHDGRVLDSKSIAIKRATDADKSLSILQNYLVDSAASHLYFTDSKLKLIANRAIDNNSDLVFIDFSGSSSLEFISHLAFVDNPVLRKIDLSGTAIKSFDRRFSHLECK